MKKTFLLLAGVAALSLTACNDTNKTGNDTSEKEAAMKERFKILNECFSSGKTEAIDTLLSADGVDHTEDTSMHLPKGPAGLKQMIKMWRESSPDLKSNIEMMAADGDILMAYGEVSGTNTGAGMGMPPTNKKWAAHFTDIVRFNDKMQMVEHWGMFDEMKMMRDMGLIPPTPAPGPPPPDTMKLKGK